MPMRLDEKYRARLTKKEWKRLEREIEAKFEEIEAALGGLDPQVSGFLIAQLLAAWTAAFRNEDDLRNDTGAITAFREKMFMMVCKAAMSMIDQYDAEFRKQGLPH